MNFKRVKEKVPAAYTVNRWRTTTFACATPLRCNSPKLCVPRVDLIAYNLECEFQTSETESASCLHSIS